MYLKVGDLIYSSDIDINEDTGTCRFLVVATDGINDSYVLLSGTSCPFDGTCEVVEREEYGGALRNWKKYKISKG